MATVAEHIARTVRERAHGREAHQEAVENVAAEILRQHAANAASIEPDPVASIDTNTGANDGHTV